jgi:formylglycine-generating enzyme required for sulfatase activity
MARYHRVFICHAQTDTAIGQQYADALRAKGIDVWMDASTAQLSDDLSEEIDRELRERSAFVLLVTAASTLSQSVHQQLSRFDTLRTTDATHYVNGVERIILFVRLNDEIPSTVRSFFWLDAANQPVTAMVKRIAAVLALAHHAASPPEEIAIPARLRALGFRGYRASTTGVEYILPPTCDVPAGPFLMGSADTDFNDFFHNDWTRSHFFDDNRPQYHILVDAFVIGKYPVTVAEYACYLHANPEVSLPPGSDAGMYGQMTRQNPMYHFGWHRQLAHPDHPVVCVSWYNARNYAAWLTQVTGQPWRLPTEAEWEKAARWDEAAQHARLYPWGDEWDTTRVNADNGVRTTPVGSCPTGASPYGAQDMLSSISEWTSSRYTYYPYSPALAEDADKRILASIGRSGPFVPYGGGVSTSPATIRVERGGLANSISDKHKPVASRDWSFARDRSSSRGFRLARGIGG